MAQTVKVCWAVPCGIGLRFLFQNNAQQYTVMSIFVIVLEFLFYIYIYLHIYIYIRTHVHTFFLHICIYIPIIPRNFLLVKPLGTDSGREQRSSAQVGKHMKAMMGALQAARPKKRGKRRILQGAAPQVINGL